MNAELDALAANGSDLLVRCPNADDSGDEASGCSNPAARVTMVPDWQARCTSDPDGTLRWEGEPIPIIGCGNPWHYVEDVPQARSKGSTDDVVMRARAERIRQIEVEGYDIEHDVVGGRDGLAKAAASYLLAAAGATAQAMEVWPWAPVFYKPRNFTRNVERALALAIAAVEVDEIPWEAEAEARRSDQYDAGWAAGRSHGMKGLAEEVAIAKRNEHARVTRAIAERLWSRIYRRPEDPPWQELTEAQQKPYVDMARMWAAGG